jgi:hypothetical protein
MANKKLDQIVILRNCGKMEVDGEAWLSDDALKGEMS